MLYCKLTFNAERSTLNDPSAAEIDIVNLNHIFLFLSVISSLLVLARAWRPSSPYGGWRIAALTVLAITCIAWLLWRGAAGYIGGSAWFVLLFLPAIGLRKMTELAAQRNYRSARKLGVVLQILHPTSEMRSQVQFLRQLESQANHRNAFSSVPIGYESARPRRHSQLRSAPAVLILILLNAIVFLFEISVGDWNDPEVLHRVGALDPYSARSGSSCVIRFRGSPPVRALWV